MPPPLAYFISWTTKGSWLHGDSRGWVERGKPGIKTADPERRRRELRTMEADPVFLEPRQRTIAAETIRSHCDVRRWRLHALNVRSNHVHVVVTAAGVAPETVMEQFKAWSSRRLNELAGERIKWWTPHGSTRWINDERSLAAAIDYVLNRQ